MKQFDICESNRELSNYGEKIGELKIDLLERGLRVQWWTENGYERARLLYAEDIYKLMELYDVICNSNDPYAYRLGKFAQKVLKETGADYDTELYPINI